MSKLFRTVLAINAAFFCLAGIYEWTFYLSPARHSELLLPDSPVSAAKDHPSFWGFWGSPRNLRAIPGDARSTSLRRAAVIVFAYNRPGYLNETLRSLASLSGLSKVTVYISQDGSSSAVEHVVVENAANLSKPYSKGFEHWQRPRVAALGDKQPGHAWLSQHYKWGLERLFEPQRRHSHAIICEDDMQFSPDFLHLFAATAILLDKDPSLWCVSSWNDNGLVKDLDWDPKRMFRTSYFPGLGWMMRRQLWDEIGHDWPMQSWDHWMRLNSTSQGRECIAPELNRNRNIGERGANMDRSVFKKFLSKMTWNSQMVTDYGDLRYLLAENYNQNVRSLLDQAKPWPWQVEGVNVPPGKVFLFLYTTEAYAMLARRLRIWPFPRAHHYFLTILPYRHSTILMADSRFCNYLPESDRVRPTLGLQPWASTQGQSCSDACGQQEMLCSTPDFWFINSCETLREHFPCTHGCATELGPDLPNYVMGPDLETYQTCLVFQKQPKCNAAHPSTARLCPCVPLHERQLPEVAASQAEHPLGMASGTVDHTSNATSSASDHTLQHILRPALDGNESHTAALIMTNHIGEGASISEAEITNSQPAIHESSAEDEAKQLGEKEHNILLQRIQQSEDRQYMKGSADDAQASQHVSLSMQQLKEQYQEDTQQS
ncbi:hypothetical protein WJX84_001936 [Apatococcus fuscideae]|uniref:Alpha-1,3-mannosyl-glycoprotein 2-beta-N-acetylglucosaminyltransferase n=1 Tax=Apatococcus fuscideae TaxID=2026836 RepID=A0AAW1SMK8_9CHLO